MTSDTSLKRVIEMTAEISLTFRENCAQTGPCPTATADQLRASLGGAVPEVPMPGDKVIDALAQGVEGGLMGTVSPNFFGWVMGASNPVGVMADWLASTWGQVVGLYETAPAAAMAEQVAAEWLTDILDLPNHTSVGFVTGATVANTVGLAAGRSDVLDRAGWNFAAQGFWGAPPVQVFLGEEAHTTVYHALRFLGFGEQNLVRVPSDRCGRMRSDELERALGKGVGPKIIVAQAGHVNTGDFDEIDLIAELAERHHAWLHVDGAFGTWARACPDVKHLTNGLDRADSIATDGHKWLQVPYDSGYVFLKNKAAHEAVMTISASYLPEAEKGVRDPSRYVPELSRRARGFPTWAVLKALGRQGIADMVGHHCKLAKRLRDLIVDEPGIAVLNEVRLNQVLIGIGDGADAEADSAFARRIMSLLRDENRHFVGGTMWQGRWALRVSISSELTQEKDIEALAADLIRLVRQEKDLQRKAGA